MTEMSRILNLVDVTSAYTEEVKTQLVDKIGNLDSEIFSGLNLFGISKKLIDLGVEIDQHSLDPASKYLLAQMIEMEVFLPVNQVAQPTSPIEVTVNQAKTPEQMELPELLEAINKNPSNLRYRQALLRLPEVALAQYYARNRPVFAGSDRKLDIAITTASLEWVRDGNPYREEFEGCFLMNLDDILDAGQIQYIHPIDGSKLPTKKIDEFGLDYSLIDLQVHKSYVWIGIQWNTFGPDSIKKQLDRMTFKDIHQDMIDQGEITQKVLAKFTHACGSKGGAMIEDISIKWPTQSRNHAAHNMQFQDMSSQGGQNYGTKPVYPGLHIAQLRGLINACLPVYNTFTQNQDLGQRIRSLLEYSTKQLKVKELTDAIWKVNPRAYTEFVASLTSNQSSTTVNQTGKYNTNIAIASGDRSVAIGGDLVMGDKVGTKIITGDGNITGNYNVVQIGDNNYFK
jgi:hypothetical protein